MALIILKKNRCIYEKWFANAPRYLFRAVNKKYNLTEKVICDVGCSYGMNLLFCKPGSYGLEIDEYAIKFAKGLGLRVYRRNIIEDDISDPPPVDAIWCSAVLEHVDSPHIFLRKLPLLLNDNGCIIIYVPTIPLFSVFKHLPWIGRYFTGHLAEDHINFFVPETLRLTCERAGFETVEVSPFYLGILALVNHVPILNRLIDGVVYIEKIKKRNYPEKTISE